MSQADNDQPYPQSQRLDGRRLAYRALKYRLFNGLFHLVHICIILFVMLAWIFPLLRPWHLGLTVLTLACWFLLGVWFGPGYCPVSDWHWRLKQALGEGRPNQSYIHYVMQKLIGRQFDGKGLDLAVVVGTIVVLGLSLWLNFFNRAV